MADIWVDDFESATGATSQAGVMRTLPNHTSGANGSFDDEDDHSGRFDGIETFAGDPFDFAFSGFTGHYLSLIHI